MRDFCGFTTDTYLRNKVELMATWICIAEKTSAWFLIFVNAAGYADGLYNRDTHLVRLGLGIMMRKPGAGEPKTLHKKDRNQWLGHQLLRFIS